MVKPEEQRAKEAAEYNAALARLGIWHPEAGKLFGVDHRSSRRWADNERAIPKTIWRLLWILENYPVVMVDFRKKFG